MAKFKMGVTVPAGASKTARLGSAADAGGRVTDAETGKLVKLAGDSQYDAVVAGDPIEGIIRSREPATQDGWSIGSVLTSGRIACTCDGLEATPGTGTVAVGDYVVAGTVVAKGTALGEIETPKVVVATNQPDEAFVSTLAGGDTAAAVKVVLDEALVAVADAAANGLHGWRVVSIGVAGAVGDSCIIEKV